jgi:hypothetical protein
VVVGFARVEAMGRRVAATVAGRFTAVGVGEGREDAARDVAVERDVAVSRCVVVPRPVPVLVLAGIGVRRPTAARVEGPRVLAAGVDLEDGAAAGTARFRVEEPEGTVPGVFVPRSLWLIVRRTEDAGTAAVTVVDRVRVLPDRLGPVTLTTGGGVGGGVRNENGSSVMIISLETSVSAKQTHP